MPWTALQSFAWAVMLLKNSRQFTLTEAVARTFDGEHPCEMCKHIAKAQHDPVKKDAVASVMKIDLFSAPPNATLSRGFSPVEYRALSAVATRRAETPPSPPPRLV